MRLLPGAVESEEFPLRRGGVTTIGRSGCDAAFADDTMLSPQHASIAATEEGWRLRDDGSAGGVFLELPPADKREVRPGDLAFEIAPLIDDVVSTVQPLIDKRSNRLELDLDPEVGAMRADQTKVRQVLFNLLSNASKFTRDGTISLAVHGRREGGEERVVFEVADTGIGMSEEQVTRVFEAFTQADASTTREYGGTGLGLTISKRFCRLMGGDLTVRSAEGTGTTFTVELPAAVSEPASTPPPWPPRPRRWRRHRGAPGRRCW